ncbi:MAG: response regulator [Candidatus Marinimicrobia bacterium]|nr:response regulator [Candidatus Neomarinimicrobiota bacterium]
MPEAQFNPSKIETLHGQLAALLNSTPALPEFSEKFLDILLSESTVEQRAVVIFDANKGIITFPFAEGLRESTKPQAYRDINSPLMAVLQNAQPLLVEQLDYLGFCQDTSLVKSPPTLWAGCPILMNGKAFAAIVFSGDSMTSTQSIRNIFHTLTPFCKVVSPYLQIKLDMENLKNSEEKYRRLADSSIDITFQITLNGYISYISSNVKTIFGIDPRHLIGKHFESFTLKSQAMKIRNALKTIGDGKSILNLPITQKDVSGSITPMEINGSPIYRDGEVIGAQGTVRDISERHQAQQEIERLSFFPMTNPMPVVEVDLEGVPSYINPAGIQLLDRMNLDMSQVSQILPSSFKQDIRRALEEKTIIPSREVSLDGFDLLWSGFFLENQNLLHFYGTDITTLKNTEAELIAAKKTAIKNEQVKTLFLANMSHEIRTPLNSILGFTELIEEEVKHSYDNDLKSYFDIIRASGKRLWQTVHEILDISQIETGTFSLKIETIDLAQILKEIANSFSATAAEKKIDLRIDIPAEEIQIAADAYCATQALSNLVDNAIKYTNEGYVSVDTEFTGNVVKVHVQDTGIGMSKGYQDQMFNAFSQESTGYTKHFQGVGLGLALAHRYLKLIKSDLEIQSEQDIGTTFTITFPVNAEVPAFVIEPKTTIVSPSPAPSAPASDSSKKYILIVEDDPNSRKLAELTLRKEFDLCFAESVIEAKNELEINQIDLILLDLSLKGDEDGLDLARFVRNQETLASIPIIALTAHAFTSDRDRCIEVGCDEFITKPFRRADLLELIYKLIQSEGHNL